LKGFQNMWDNKTVEWLDIELTSFCNIDCPGCFRQVKRKTVNNILNKDYIKLEDLKKWLNRDELPNLKLVNFCGSIDEPTLHPEFLKIVNFLIPEVDVNLATNGSTRTKKFWAELGKKKISAFFGVDGIDQQSLEKYRIGSSFKKVQENWRSFIEAGGKATWQFIVFEHNEHLLEKAKEMAKDEGFENFRVIHSHRKDNQEKGKKKRSEEQEIVCKYGIQKRIFLSHTGALLPCCFLNSEFLQSHAGGGLETRFTKKYEELTTLSNNLKYNTFSEVIDGDLFNFVTESWKNKPIERCWTTCKQAKQDVFEDESVK